MSELLIVVIPSLIAIVVMVLLIKATGIARPVLLDDDAPVRQTIAEHFEGAKIDRIVRSADGTGALVDLQNHTPGLVLVRAMGDRLAVRALGANSIRHLSGKDTVLYVTLNDFTWPRTRLVFEDTARRTQAENALSTANEHTTLEPTHA